MNILADSSLPGLEQAFPKPFKLSLYTEAHEIPNILNNQQILLCRSTLKVNKALLDGHSSSLRYVATASSGTDHIDTSYLQAKEINVIDAKGSNAPAVADYVIATLAFLEKYKAFRGTRAGIIGLGKVGTMVAKRLNAIGMEILCYDPPKSELDSQFHSCSFESLMNCDLLCIHANLHDHQPYPSRNLLNAALLSQLKPGSVIINTSRGGIVDEEALVHLKNAILYCTDVYAKEPQINPKTVAFATLCTPHIAGHSIEAKYAAITMVSQKLHHLYQLPPPKYLVPAVDQSSILTANESWQDTALSLYNPIEETNHLKGATNLELAFQILRKAHQSRHDFSVYSSSPWFSENS